MAKNLTNSKYHVYKKKIYIYIYEYVTTLFIVFQVKMKNLRREVRLFKESRCRLSTRKPSEVANACQKLLPIIEEIFNRVQNNK